MGCEWASPIVVIRKSNGKLRICGDYKEMVNDQTVNDSYLVPNLETVSHNGEHKDIRQDRLESSISTDSIGRIQSERYGNQHTFGIFSYKHLNFGIKNASHIFQHAMETIVQPLKSPGMIIYQDDIFIDAANNDQLEKRLMQVASSWQNAGMTINEDKSIMKISSVTFLDYRISSDGIRPDAQLTIGYWTICRRVIRKRFSDFWALVNTLLDVFQLFKDLALPLTTAKKKVLLG